MNKSKQGYSTIEFLLVLGLLLLFTFGSLMLIRTGSGFYQKMTGKKDVQTDIRIATAYINNKLRQNDVSGGIHIKEVEAGKQAIVLTEKIAGSLYDTWVFSKDGYLREALVPFNQQPDFGESFEIIKLSSMEVTMLKNATLQVDLKDEQKNLIQLIYKIKSAETR